MNIKTEITEIKVDLLNIVIISESKETVLPQIISKIEDRIKNTI